jgi:flagellar basal body-associated protein FliL
MNPAGTLILLIVAISTAAVGVMVYQQVVSSTQQSVSTPQEISTVRLISAGVGNITNNTAGHVRIAVTADKPVRINDTLITLRVGDETAYLTYRDGDLLRDETTGYYTQ